MLEHEIALRLFCFLTVLCCVALWEALRPKRIRQVARKIRWRRNLSLVVINSFFIRLLVPFTAVGVALYAHENQLGLLNYVSLPFEVVVIVSVLLMDLLIYGQHVVFHYVPWLWRLHKVHHIDQEIDVTTGLRFHPVEILLSSLIKCASVLLLGIPVVAVVIFEILLNATAMFNHGNIRLPLTVDRILRLMVVTPDMHRVHHSMIPQETNSNFGFNMPWWDRIFGTYRAQPEQGHIKMEIGLQEYRPINKTGLWALMVIPFLRASQATSDKASSDKSNSDQAN
ncbi:MAG: sterol desaturase family protein [Emcibacter sp.]|nr:sterol desaturase family protein [Emcibacter sp.]